MLVDHARGKNRSVRPAVLVLVAAVLWLAACAAPFSAPPVARGADRPSAASRTNAPALLVPDIAAPTATATQASLSIAAPAAGLGRHAPDPAEVPLPVRPAKPAKNASAPEIVPPATAVVKAVAVAINRAVDLAAGDTKESPSVVITRDVPYATIPGVDPRFLTLDIYAKRGLRNRPVIIFIHGGGWNGGDKSDVGKKPELFTGAGDVLVSINYRLLPSGRHPENVRDVARAVAWIHTNAARFGGNPAALYLVGHSAGAHLAGLVTTDERYLAAQKLTPAMFKGVVLLDSNAYDIPVLMKHLAGSDNLYTQAFGRDAAKDLALWQDASPALHVAPGKGIPPFLVVHTHDTSRKEQAEDMAGKLAAAGIHADLLDIGDRDHGSLCELIGQPGDKTTAAIMKFLAALGA